MRLLTPLIILFLIISSSFNACPESLVIATYRDGSITNEDLRFYAEKQKSPIAFLDLSKQGFSDTAKNSSGRVENAVSDLAFFDLLYRKRLAEQPLNATDSYRVHSELRRYTVNQYFLASLRSKIEITDREIEQYYRQHEDQFIHPEQVKIAFLFRLSTANPESRKQARKLLQGLMERKDFSKNFEKYARAYSQAPSARTGGVMEYFPRGKYSPEIDRVAFALEPGQLSEIVERDKGFYVIKCLDRKSAGQQQLSEVEGQIRNLLIEEQFKKIRNDVLSGIQQGGDFDLWRKDSMPAPADTVIRVGDYSITRTMLESEWGSFTYVPWKVVQKRIEALSAEELLYHTIVSLASETDPQLARNLNILRSEMIAIDWLHVQSEKRIQVEEKEIHAYWKQHREIYHTGARKEIEYLLFSPSSNLKTKEENLLSLLTLDDQVQQYYDQWMQIPQADRNFESWSASVIQDCTGVKKNALGMVANLPGDWRESRPLSDFGVGYLSPPIKAQQGYVLFYVKSEGKPQLMSYEQAREKVESVVRHKKYVGFRDDLRKQLLAQADFQFKF